MATIIKKVTVGTPEKRVTGGWDINNLVGVDTTGKINGDILVYDASKEKYVTATVSTGNGLTFTWNDSDQIFQLTLDSAEFDSDVRDLVSVLDAGGDGSLTYNSSTGVITYTGPSASEVRSHFSAGTHLNYDSSTGIFSLPDNTHLQIAKVTTSNDINVNGVLTSPTIQTSKIDGDSDNIYFENNVDVHITGEVVADSGTFGDLRTLAYRFPKTDAALVGQAIVSDANGNLSFAYAGTESGIVVSFTEDLADVANNLGDTKYPDHFLLWDSSFTVYDSNGQYVPKVFGDEVHSRFVSGTGLTYDSATGRYSITVTGVDSGVYGSASLIPVITVNPQGQIDSIGTVSVAGVTSTTYDSATGVLTINTADGNSFLTTLHDSDDRISEIRNAISASGDLSYNSTTGVFSFDVENVYTKSNFDSDFDLRISETDLLDSTDAKNIFSVTDVGGDGSLSYDNSTGVFTYTGPSAAEVRAHLSASGDLTYDSSTGRFSIDVEQIYTSANFDSDLDAALNSGTGISYNSVDNTINLDSTGVIPGSYGSASLVPVVTVNAQGQIDSIGTVSVAGVSSVSFDSASYKYTINTADGGTYEQMIHTRIPGTAGTYGSASQVPVIIVNEYGLVDSVTTVSVAGVSSTTYDSTSGVFTINTADGGVFNTTIHDSDDRIAEIRRALVGSGDISYDQSTGVISIDVEEIYTKANFDSDFDLRISETDLLDSTDAKNLLSVTDAGGDGSLTYNNETGTFTYTGPSATEVRAHLAATDAGGDGSFTYDSATGNFTYTGPSASEVRAHFTGGTGVTITDGDVAIGQDVGTTSDVTFGTVNTDSAVADNLKLNIQTAAPNTLPGTIYFDSDEQRSLSVYLRTIENPNPNIQLNVGQEILVYVHNLTGGPINKGQVVYISGTAHGKHPQVSLAKADAAQTASGTGVTLMDIPDGAHGWVSRYGIVRGLNTGGLVAGADIYLSKDSDGEWTTTEVTVNDGYPFHIGRVLGVDSTNGSILVDPFREHYEYLRIQDILKVTGPITGAKITVDSAVSWTPLDYQAIPPWNEGTSWYDEDEHTLMIHTADSDFPHMLGARDWVRVRNSSGADIEKGTPVYSDGVHISGHPIHGHHPLVYPADAADAAKYEVLGITGHKIPNGSHGFVVTRGVLTNINTTGLVSGDRFHLAPGGGIQLSAPNYPNYPIDLGIALTIDSAGGGGSYYVEINDHTMEQLRVTGNGRFDGSLTIGGNLNVVGTTTSVVTQDVQVSSNFLKLLDGNTLGTSYQSYGGLNDATFTGSYRGDSALFYFVRITALDSSGDTIEWGISDSDQMLYGSYAAPYGYGAGFDSAGGQTSWNLGTDGLTAPLRNNISIQFANTSGHGDSDVWCAHPTELNTDLGFVGNYNPAGPGGIKYAGLYRDVTDTRWKFFEGLTQNLDSSVVEISDSQGFTLSDVQASTFIGALSGNATSATSATQLTTGRDIAISGDITAAGVTFDGTGNITLSAGITAGAIVNADINATAAIADTKLATISTSGKVQNSATTATATNTGSAIVTRDPSGNFSAGTITATLTGNASSADSATVAATAVDAQQLNNQAPSYYLDYDNFTNKPFILDSNNVASIITDTDFVDSTDVSNIIIADVDKTFVDALNINADTLDGQEGSYYQDASNLNAGTIDSARLPVIAQANFADSATNAAYAVQSGYTTGNAATATALETARDIAGVSFDGTANISLALTNLGISDGSANQVLTTNGSGTFTFEDLPPGTDSAAVQAIIGATPLTGLSGISDGTSGQFLKTDGAGNFTFDSTGATNATANRFTYTVTSETDSINGADDIGRILTYTAPYVDVYLNGVKLRNGTNVTVTTGTNIVFDSAIATTGTDYVDVIAYNVFDINATTLTDLSGIVDGTNGQVMRTDGNGNFFFDSAIPNATTRRFQYTVSSLVDSLNGPDDIGRILTYDSDFVDVYVNGVKMRNGTDVFVNTGTSIVFDSAVGDVTNPDLVDIIAYNTFQLNNTTLTDLNGIVDGTNGQVLRTDGVGNFFFDSAIPNATTRRFQYTVNASADSLNGADDNGRILQYDSGFVDVYLNGVRLRNNLDVFVNTGTSLVFDSAIGTTGTPDYIDVVAYNTFQLNSTALTDLNGIVDGLNGQVLKTNGAGLFYFDSALPLNATSSRFQYNVSSAIDSVSGNDINGNLLAYDSNFVDVYLNGVKLRNGTDVFVTYGDKIVFDSNIGTSGTDELDIIAYNTFEATAINASNITTGILSVGRGGTGLGSLGSADQVIQMNASGTALEYGKIATANLDDNAVTTAKLADSAVTAAKVANDAITTDKIINDAVTGDKLANSITIADTLTVTGTLSIAEALERATIDNSTTGTINFDALTQAVIFYDTAQTANRTVNFRGDGSTTLDSIMAVGESMTFVLLMTQTGTAYYLNTYQVDGSSVTPKWSGGTAPSGGNTNSVDAYTFTILKTASATFSVFAGQVQYA